MAEHIQMLGRDLNGGPCSVDAYKELLVAFRMRDPLKLDKILSNIDDPDHWFGDPDYGTLLDMCAMDGKCSGLIRIVLKHGADPNKINPVRKKGPIHVISQNNDIESLRVLLESPKIDVNLLDNTGSSALHYAAKQEDTNATAIKLLIEYNADINLLNRKNKSPLHIAIDNDNIEAINLLIEAGANLELKNIDGETLKDIIINDFPDIDLKNLLTKSKTVRKTRNEVTHNDLFAFLRERRYDDFVENLKDNKQLLEENDGYHTFLQYSCEFGLEEFVEALLNLGADPNKTNPALRQTPLMLAARRGHPAIISKLLRFNDILDFSPVDSETVLHCVVDGMQSLTVNGHSDYLQCLNILLTKAPKTKLNINQQDFKGNTALHYAAKLRQDRFVLLLLEHGAYIGVENIMHEPACADIAYDTFLEHLDTCIATNDALPREDNFEITFNYDFLLMKKWNNNEMTDIETNIKHNKYILSETLPLLHIAKNRELRPLLKHPIFTSFLHLKWNRIKKYFYINLCFYLLFWIFLTSYILGIYSNQTVNKMENLNSTLINENQADNKSNPIWIIVTFLLILLFLRELFQLCISPVKYITSAENWLEIGIIIITFIILFTKSSVVLKHQISAIGIMLSWSELVLLIGRHPALSTNIEMLKTVSYNFLKFLAWYSILIIAFALSFYTLFKDSVSDDENFFEDPGNSVFKTVVMLTGEFDASSIPFVQHPITSHVLFVLFVFLIAIVLFNLLNGLAVSDTQAIRSDAELVSIVSRSKLISYLEETLANPSTIIETLSKCLAFTYKPISSINLAQSLQQDQTVRVLPNMGYSITAESLSRNDNSLPNKKWKSRKRDPCPDILLGIYMDPSVVERASHVLKCKSERLLIQKAKEEEKEKEKQLKEEINNFRQSLKTLTDMVLENKTTLDNILQGLSTKYR
ncbi:hypothetical protein O3M35_003760 [Rhynocoris fuscipes]|uniref:Ion transport domain-containing protein n=1 Tax=Rhynocoris fuscipes TaxID=488301 RepID=A0AAW1CK61_9HEMI